MFGRKNKEVIVNLNLIEGLPFDEGTSMKVKLTHHELELKAMDSVVKLPTDKITSIEYKNEIEMEKLIQQSAPGMIIGAATFGLLGALVGGRTKTKKKRIVHHFVLINYYSDEQKTIITTTQDTSNVKLVDAFNKFKPQSKTQIIEL